MAEIKMSVPIEKGTHAKLEKLAKKDGRALGRYVAKVLEAHVDQAAKGIEAMKGKSK